MINYENVNRNAPYNPDFLTRQIPLARQLLSQNVPIENIIQQTGLPRETVQQLLTSTQNIPRPSMPSAQPSGIGTLSNQVDPIMGNVENLGTDINDYLVNELGFDPLMMTEPDMPEIDAEIEEPTPVQNVNRANAKVMVEDPSQAKDLLEVQATLSESDLDENNIIDVYKMALADYAGLDLKSLIPLPNKNFSILMAGLDLIESGTKGEDWTTALSSAAATGFAQYAKEKRDYDKQILGIDLQTALNNDKAMKDFIGKQIDYQLKLKNEELTGARKQYMVTVPGATDGTIMQLNAVQVGRFQNMGANLLEYDASKMGATKNYIITYNDGKTFKTLLNDADAEKYRQDVKNGKLANIEAATATSDSDDFGVLVRDKNAPPGTQYNFDYVSKTGLTDLLNDETKNVVPLKDLGGSYEVIDREDGVLKRIPAVQYFANADQYKLKRGLSGSLTTADGTSLTFGDGESLMNNNTAGKAVEVVVDQVRSRKFLTNEVLRLAGNTIDTILGMDNPDLAFDNMAGRGVDVVKAGLTNINALTSMFSQPVVRDNQGRIVKGYTFSITNDDGTTQDGLSFNEFRNKVIQTEYFKEFEKSPLGRFITNTNVDRGVAQSQLFTLALVGAAAAGGSADLDLRAISDKDMDLFMTRVGARASNAGQFLGIVNQFMKDIIETEINYLNSMLDMPLKQSIEVKNPETGKYELQEVDLFEKRGLGKQRIERLKELEIELEKINARPSIDVFDENYAVSGVGGLRTPLEPMGGVSPTTPISVTVPGVQNPSYEEVVGYVMSLPDTQARNYLLGLEKTYGKRNPKEFKLLLNFVGQARSRIQ